MKARLVIVVILIIVLVIGIILLIKPTKQSNSDIEYRVISRYSEEENIIISDIEEYEEFIENSNLQEIHLDKYNEQFFKGKSLAIAFINTSSGSIEIIIDDIKVAGNKLNIEYSLKHPESGIGTMDMSGKIIVVEVNKNINKINLK